MRNVAITRAGFAATMAPCRHCNAGPSYRGRSLIHARASADKEPSGSNDNAGARVPFFPVLLSTVRSVVQILVRSYENVNNPDGNDD